MSTVRGFRAPPSGPPEELSNWDGPIEQAYLLFIDLEMTGLQPEQDRVIELCAELVRGEEVLARIDSLIRPECGRFGNERIHGIKAEDLLPAPSFAEVLSQLEPLLSQAVLVAHGAAFDVVFLRKEAERAGRELSLPTFLDTLPVSRRAFPFPRHALSELAKTLSLGNERSHRAAGDVATLRRLFSALCARLKPACLRELFEVGIRPRGPSQAVVEALQASLTSASPVKVTYRRTGKPITEGVLSVQKVETELDPPVVLGYWLPSRGRTQLRLDRIISVIPSQAG